jgi:hypothetical protein
MEEKISPLEAIRIAPVGTLIWAPVINKVTHEDMFAFMFREESRHIQRIPRVGFNPLIESRAGMVELDVGGGRKVYFITVMFGVGENIYETNINVLHIDDHIAYLLKYPLLLLFYGDSLEAEARIQIGFHDNLEPIVVMARKLFKKQPWTDEEFDLAKAQYETMTGDAGTAWNMLSGRKKTS